MSTPNVTFYKQTTPVTTEGAITFDPTNLQITVGTGTRAQIVASSRPDTTLGDPDINYYLTGVECPDSTSDPQTLYCDKNESIYFNNSLLHAPSLSCETLECSNNLTIGDVSISEDTVNAPKLVSSSLQLNDSVNKSFIIDNHNGFLQYWQSSSYIQANNGNLSLHNSFGTHIELDCTSGADNGVYIHGFEFEDTILLDDGIINSWPTNESYTCTIRIPGIIIDFTAPTSAKYTTTMNTTPTTLGSNSVSLTSSTIEYPANNSGRPVTKLTFSITNKTSAMITLPPTVYLAFAGARISYTTSANFYTD